jgi:hypothetical protein
MFRPMKCYVAARSMRGGYRNPADLISADHDPGGRTEDL